MTGLVASQISESSPSSGRTGVEGQWKFHAKTDYTIRMLSSLVRSPKKLLSVRDAAENVFHTPFARSIQHDLVIAGRDCQHARRHSGMLAVILLR